MNTPFRTITTDFFKDMSGSNFTNIIYFVAEEYYYNEYDDEFFNL